VAFAVALAVACSSGSNPRPEASRPELRPISLPDISRAAESVQQQIRERFAQLEADISQPAASSAELAAAYGEMGKLLTAAEFYDAAEICFVNAGTLASRDMQWPYLLGHLFRLRNDSARAATFFGQALELAPDHVPSLVWLAEMQLALNRPDAAEPLLVKAGSLDPSSGAASYALGRAALAKRDYMRAVTHLESALALAPHATRIHYQLALAYRGLGNNRKADEHLRLRGDGDLPPADPIMGELTGLLQNAAAHERRGVQAMNERLWAEAAEHLRKAIELAPNNAFTRLNLGTSLYLLGDPKAALEHYRAAVRLSPDLARAHVGIGVVMEAQRQDRQAIEAFAAAVKSDPGYVEARFSLANALRRTGRVRESLPHYEEILRLNPAVSQASFGYAMGLVRLERYQDARRRLEADVKIFPDQAGFAHALARLLAAAPDDRARDGTRALALVRPLLEQQRTLALAETMAMTLAELGRFNEAVAWQREALDMARRTDRTEMIARLEGNLRLYANGQPCRVPWTNDDPVHYPQPSTE
jgi:tetratricopeptide (TPR) repeat protein